MIRHQNDENSRPSCQSSFLQNPPDSTGMTRFLQELGGHCKDLTRMRRDKEQLLEQIQTDQDILAAMDTTLLALKPFIDKGKGQDQG